MHELDAVFAFVIAAAAAALLTPLISKLAFKVGAVDQPTTRGLSDREMPRLGGVAILIGVLLATLIWIPLGQETEAIIAGMVLITLIGALDDIFDLPAGVKLIGQITAALIPVLSGVRVDHVTLPFIGALDLGYGSGPLTLLGLVAVINVVNLTDGIDGLAAGLCTIVAATFALIAFDLGKDDAAVLAAITAGGATGFLVHNFHPASIFMGDSGSNLLGFLLGCITVQGTLKTNAVVALVLPLVLLAVPFMDTSFVIAKRIKYRKPIYHADAWHFHHRLTNIGFSQRRTVLYLYGWTLTMAGMALALRFIPYSDDHGHFQTGWTLALLGYALLALIASIYLILVLEILSFKRLRSRQLRSQDPQTSEHEIDLRVQHDLETGEFPVV